MVILKRAEVTYLAKGVMYTATFAGKFKCTWLKISHDFKIFFFYSIMSFLSLTTLRLSTFFWYIRYISILFYYFAIRSCGLFKIFALRFYTSLCWESLNWCSNSFSLVLKTKCIYFGDSWILLQTSVVIKREKGCPCCGQEQP